MKKSFWVLSFLCIRFLAVYAQDVVLHSPQLQFIFADSLARDVSQHPVFAPYVISAPRYHPFFYTSSKSKEPLAGSIRNGLFQVTPVFDADISWVKEFNGTFPAFGQGVHGSGRIGNWIGFDVTGEVFQQRFPTSVRDSIIKLDLVQGYNRPWGGSGSWSVFGTVRGSIWWNASRYLTFKAGYDKQFWGDGHRSLFLSENAAAYPYVQMDMHVWKIRYVFQTLFLTDILYGQGATRSSKYISMHQLSYNLTKRLSVYAFEAIVWSSEDSVRYRNFDVHYLNPFVFFRPIEYNLGSPDNMVFGLGGRLRLFSHAYLYGQLLLDEFRLQELKANNGWWGNKYGLQAGFKTYGLTQKFPSMLLFEANHVTPYTYSHTAPLENYGYQRQSLAHPRGCNFDEAVMVFRMMLRQRHFLHWEATATRFGTNIPGENNGGDMYEPMWTFKNLYGNKTGQGVTTYEATQSLQYGYLISPAWRLNAFITLSALERRVSGETNLYPSLAFGFKTLLYEK